MSIPDPIVHPQVKYTQLFINNEWVNSTSGKVFPTINPSTGEKICDVQEGDKADVDKAVAAAREAFKLGSKWRWMNASKRGVLLNKLADLLERDGVYLASLDAMDMGKPYKDAYRIDVNFAVSCLRFYAGAADKLSGQSIPVDGPFVCYTRLEPIGVCGLITTWNYPTCEFVFKVAAAVAAGCTCVLKPAEATPLSALYLTSLVQEAGFPPGVVNVVPGYGPTAGAALTEHMDVDMISFTGPVSTGRLIMTASAKTNMKKVVMEMGGKSPTVVFPDADLDSAVELSHAAVMNNMGAICCAGSRTYVHEDIYDEFVRKSVERAQRKTVGDPYDASNENGAQVNEIQFNKILGMIKSGQEEGATLLCGGSRHGTVGYFIQPTVFTDVTEEMLIGREEIFGPVQCIYKFKTTREVIGRANNNKYGLAATVVTKDVNTALVMANSLNAGTVWVNTTNMVRMQAPFGGYKMSGIGRDKGMKGLEEYCEIKTVMLKVDDRI